VPCYRLNTGISAADLVMEILYAEALGSTNQQYGIAATCAVAFPIALFFRIHFPGQVLTAVMTPVTFGIVIGK